MITSDVANPQDVGTIAVPVTVNPYAGWFPVCGNSNFISDNSAGKVTPPTSVGTNQIVITRTLNLTAAQLASATFTLTAKADDAVTVIVNGNTGSPALTCGGTGLPSCFYSGCDTISGPNSTFQNQFTAGANTITIVIQDEVGDHIAGDYELCACYPLSLATPTATPGPVGSATPTPIPTAIATMTPVLTPAATPTITPTPDTYSAFYVSKNVFSSSNPVSVFVALDQYPGNFELSVYNSAGEFIVDLDKRSINGPYQNSYLWDGTNRFKEKCASGVYILYLVEPFDKKTKRLLLIH